MVPAKTTLLTLLLARSVASCAKAVGVKAVTPAHAEAASVDNEAPAATDKPRNGPASPAPLPSYEEAMSAELEARVPTATRSLDATDIENTMEPLLANLFPCVSTEISGSTGVFFLEVGILIAVRGDGELLGASAESGSAEFDQCIRRAMRGARFPAFAAARAGARYTFNVDLPGAVTEPSPVEGREHHKHRSAAAAIALEALRARTDSLRACVGSPGGDIPRAFRFAVSVQPGTGRIEQARLLERTLAPELETCLLEALQAARLPATMGDHGAFIYGVHLDSSTGSQPDRSPQD